MQGIAAEFPLHLDEFLHVGMLPQVLSVLRIDRRQWSPRYAPVAVQFAD
jgi:hypothetical protein